MFCLKCGELIPDGCNYCPKCGEKVIKNSYSGVETPAQSLSHDDSFTAVVGVVNPDASNVQGPQPKKKSKVLIGVISSAIIILIVIFVIQAAGKASLKKQILRDWSTVETSDGSYYTLELDFSDNEIEYNFGSAYSWLNTTISTMEYKIISPTKIKILDYDRVISIEFNDDKTMMICTPAITSTDATEYWFQFD